MKLQPILFVAACGRTGAAAVTLKRMVNIIGICAAWLAATTSLTAQVPAMIHYQGKALTMAGAPFSGAGQFKFALVSAGGAVTYWSNDGTSVAGGEPVAAVPIAVNNGIYSVLLGNPTAPFGMLQIPPGVFLNTVVYLRVWFGGAAGPFTVHVPDMRVASVGYAMNAATVVDTAITTPKLADKAVTNEKLADGAVTSSKLADVISLGSVSSPGSLQIYPGTGPAVGLWLDGASGIVLADNFQVGFSPHASLTQTSFGGRLRILDDEAHEVVDLQVSSSGTPSLNLKGGNIQVKQSSGDSGVTIYGDYFSSGAGLIQIANASGANVIKIDGQTSDGCGRITTPVLEITGGCDLSENFDITSLNDADAPELGMIVCIDPISPGHLMVSSKAYDRTVAGIMSGAGGVKPGMLMGQHGSAINGKHPVALTGRVYCQADASNGAIHPGDLLTTSDSPGHAMKVTDHARAQGSIIGKAMSSLAQGKGLVLVLVSLQ